jgi:hypothetical protein
VAVLSVANKALNQGIINRVALVLDRSGSMSSLQKQVVQVADRQVQHLATRSTDLDQETRATVYVFDHTIDCVYFDKDVLRLPSLKGSYHIGGRTALASATLNAIEDLQKSYTKYGRHSFLVFVLTDGLENESPARDITDLKAKLSSLPDAWTIACLIPRSVIGSYDEALRLGFSAGNIQEWDVSAQGLEVISQKIEQVTDTYMTMRAKNESFVGTKNLWTLTPESLTKAVEVGALDKTPYGRYTCYPVTADAPIRDFVEAVTGKPYTIGSTFYELTKTETIQPSKQIAVRDVDNGDIYTGKAARQLLNLPDDYTNVGPKFNKAYEIFVQSKSVNRALKEGTDVLVFDQATVF